MSFESSLGLSARARKRRTNWRLAGMIKIASGCIDCGYAAHAEALQFDHTGDDKKGNVSDLIRSDYSWTTIVNEINKCEVRCANCHAVKTSHRKRIVEEYSSIRQPACEDTRSQTAVDDSAS
jgi:ribosomal protein L32